MSLFYRRRIGDWVVWVCAGCEKKYDDPAQACTFHVAIDGESNWLVCKGCGERERLP